MEVDQPLNNLRALRAKDISPQIVVQALVEHLDRFQDIYVIAIDKEDGEPLFYGSGEVKNLALASAYFQAILHKYVTGEISED